MIEVYTVQLSQFREAFFTVNAQIKQQALSYKLAKKRKEYLASEWIRREVLASYLNLPPDKIVFSVSDKGRPSVKGASALDFNISHSENHVVMAVAKKGKIGIDIQSMKEKTCILSIAEKYFSASEYHALSQLAKAGQQRLFYLFWTLKEASLKLTGEGIAYGLSHYRFQIHQRKIAQQPHPKAKPLYYRTLLLDADTMLSMATDQPDIETSLFTFKETKVKGCNWQKTGLIYQNPADIIPFEI